MAGENGGREVRQGSGSRGRESCMEQSAVQGEV